MLELDIGNRDVILGLKWMEKHGVSLDPTTRRIIWPPERPALQESELPRLILWTPEDLLEPRKVDPAHQKDAERRNQKLDREDKRRRDGRQKRATLERPKADATVSKGNRTQGGSPKVQMAIVGAAGYLHSAKKKDCDSGVFSVME
ncbi:hypothetical protein E4U56_005181, partial [Claviceps arundinis]